MGLVITSGIMNILLTGANGFLGRIIKQHLSENDLTTLSRHSGDIKIDLSTSVPSFKTYFDLVIHAAGQAHLVPKNEADATLFYKHNIEATANLLLGLEKVELPKYFVYISSVSVYGLESGLEISEESPLLAKDPYGKSKIEAENLVREWCIQKGVKYTILRLPLIAGPNPPGNLGAMISGIKKRFYVNIGKGNARKSVVLADDIGRNLIRSAKAGGIYNLTDGIHPSFYDLSRSIALQLGRKNVPSIPYVLGFLLAKLGDLLGDKSPINSNKFQKIVKSLTFNDQKARLAFGWNPMPVLEGFKIN
jgi:nucleoside-diphosphate-sugar epimerase